MTTKEQERQALERIRGTVLGLGESSYIRMAMDGVLEDAERNIEEDAAYSMKQRYESAEKRAANLTEKLVGKETDIMKLYKEIEMYREKIRGMEDAAKKAVSRKPPKRCAETVMKYLAEKEGAITDGLGMAADQMARCIIGLREEECDEIKEEYRQGMNEQALKYRQMKEELEDLLGAERYFQAYMKA